MTSLMGIGETKMEQAASTRRKSARHGAHERVHCLQKPVNWRRDYSTFRKMTISDLRYSNQSSLLDKLSERIRVFRKSHSRIDTASQGNWMVGFLLFLCLAISCYHLRGRYDEYSEPEWKWDHNVYSPRQVVVGNRTHGLVDPAPELVPRKRNLLLAQFSGTVTLERMADISSRPNRAYARQWARDYVLYTGASSNRIERACFDKVYILSTILARQRVHADSVWSPPPRVQYDTVVLLPPDAIISDLDSDLLNLFPSDKLLGVASYEHSKSTNDSTFSDIVFFNLRHKLAVDVVSLWDSLTESPVTCGAGNDVELLMDAVQSVVETNVEADDLIVMLKQSPNGFVGDRAIKVIPQKVPSSKAVLLVSNLAETKAELQTTADSVCYRYYPRCDVL